MPTVRIAALAAEDLEGIWDYVAQHNPETASKLIKEITGRFAMLRDYPHSGRAQDRLADGLRSFVVRGYFIFYRPFEGGVEILRILHGSRDIERIFQRFLDSL